MADMILDVQSPTATPGAGTLAIYPDNGTKQLCTKDDSGKVSSLGGIITNANTADISANAADTYLTDGSLLIPQHGVQIGTTIKWRLGITKTGAGVAAPVFTVRAGTARTTADNAVLTFTSGSAQTAAIDQAYVEIVMVVRSLGSSGQARGKLMLTHNGNTAGFASIPVVVIDPTTANLNSTTANQYIGLSVNPGASGAWTFTVISIEMTGI